MSATLKKTISAVDFFKKLLTNHFFHSKISNVSDRQIQNNLYARVAQLVEHDLAKVGAAGSSPVSRSSLFYGKP